MARNGSRRRLLARGPQSRKFYLFTPHRLEYVFPLPHHHIQFLWLVSLDLAQDRGIISRREKQQSFNLIFLRKSLLFREQAIPSREVASEIST